MNIICCSGGNDSIALIRWAWVSKLRSVTVLYNDTGWAAPKWEIRIGQVEALCKTYNFKFDRTESMGFKAMVRAKKGFPMAASRMSFCSDVLKKQPTRNWLHVNDPEGIAVIFIGIRRCESQNRKNHPRSLLADNRYNGRPVEFPLVDFSDRDRDLMQEPTGIDILLHGSMECFPCINAKRSDFRLLAKYPERVKEISDLEFEMGYTSKNKPRVMFRPYRHMGAVGIKEVIRWGLCSRGEYNK